MTQTIQQTRNKQLLKEFLDLSSNEIKQKQGITVYASAKIEGFLF